MIVFRSLRGVSHLAAAPGRPHKPSQHRTSVLMRFAVVSCVALVGLGLVSSPAAADQSCGGGFQVGGKIEQEWIVQGKAAALGACSSAEKGADRNGRFQTFGPNTSIYWNANVAGGNAKLVRGEIYKKWQEYSWELGSLGYPTISEATLTAGKYNTFEGGSIYWSSANGAHPVFGDIRNQWAAKGYENGSYGYPITDEYEINGGFQQDFQGGPLSFQVGPDPDGDPTNTNALIGTDDPYDRYGSPFIQDLPKTPSKCVDSSDGTKFFCAQIGEGTGNDTNARTAPRAPSSSAPSSSAPSSSAPSSSAPSSSAPSSSAPSSSAPSSSAPSSSAPSSSAPSSSAPSSSAPSSESPPTSAPCTTDPTPGGTPSSPAVPEPSCVTQTTAPSANRTPAATTETQPTQTDPAKFEQPGPSIQGNTGLGHAPVFNKTTASAPKPDIPGLPEPDDPDRRSSASVAAEQAFFGGPKCSRTDVEVVGRWYADRFHTCSIESFTIQTGAIGADGLPFTTGWNKGFIFYKQTATYNDPKVEIQSRVYSPINQGSGDAIQATTELIAKDSTKVSGTDGTAPIINSPLYTYNIEKTSLAAGEVIRMNGEMRVQFTLPGPTTYLTDIDHYASYPKDRCDKLPYLVGKGCVMAPVESYQNAPLMDLDVIRGNNLYNDHILRSQNSLTAGSKIIPPVRALYRLPADDRQVRKNRSKACPSGRTIKYKPSPTINWQCDEYPFASTTQGAASDPDGGRTFSFCKLTNEANGRFNPFLTVYGDGVTRLGGYSSCIIPKDQNQAGGGLIAPFNRKNRIFYPSDSASDGFPDGYFVSPYHFN